MMASIPNMRSTPLPIPTAKTAPAGDPASAGFTVQLPVLPVVEQLPATPDLPAVAAPPVQLPTPVDLLDGIALPIAAPQGGEDGSEGEGDEAPPAKAETPKDEDEAQPAIVLPFVQQAAPVPQILPKTASADTPTFAAAATGAVPIALPRGTAAAGKKDAPAADLPDAPKTEAAATPDIESAVKALLQRKPLPEKQAAAVSKTDATDPAKAAPRPAQTEARQTLTPAAPAAVPAAAPMPAADLPQPALSPAPMQSAPAAAEKIATVDGTRTSDLAVERKLDLSRDSAWLDRLARDISRAASDDSPLRFRLHPQTLGSLQVELQQGDRGTAVRMTVDTEAARQILTDAQPRLTAEARAQGVRIAETHVDLSGSGRQAPGDQRRQDEARQTPLIRTARGADATGSTRASARARHDRYA